MRFGVLGLGSIGLRHARNLLALGHGVLGFDPDPGRRQALRGLGGEGVDDRARAIADADALVIASPSACHRDDLAAAVAAGRHAFVEKPLAHGADGIAELLGEAERRRRIVCVGFNLRFHPGVVAARALIAAGGLGRPLWARLIAASYLPDWRPGRDYRLGYAADARTGGVMFDIAHEFDLARHLLGPARAGAAAARRTGLLEIESEDLADVLLRHESGVVSHLHLDYVTRPPLRVTEVAGEAGLMRIDLGERRLALWDTGGRLRVERREVTTLDDDYRAEMAAFAAAVRGDAPFVCDGREGLAALELIVAARALAGLPGP